MLQSVATISCYVNQIIVKYIKFAFNIYSKTEIEIK